MIPIRDKLLLFLGNAPDQLAAKVAHGIAVWRPERCIGQLRLPGCQADVGLPEMTLEDAAARLGAGTLVVGVVNRGGSFEPSWVAVMLRALELGLDIASGLHDRVGDIPEVREAADRLGRRISDVRHPTESFPIGTGERRPGHRLLAVGTDCSVGKMYTALAIERAMRRRGWKATFRATGQTGILIGGNGISVDAVVSDFLSGAVEALCPAADPDHWDVIEGQASVLHPSFAGVTLGLVHGSQPDALVLCHEPGRRHMRGLPHRPVPSLRETAEAHLQAARLVNPGVRLAGLSFNTSALSDGDARDAMARAAAEFGLPCVDPLRGGVEPLLDAL